MSTTLTGSAEPTGQSTAESTAEPNADVIDLPIPPETGATLNDAERRHVTERALATLHTVRDPDTRRQALEDVVLANLGVARALAATHRDKGIPREDLEQVAYTALVAAAKRFRSEEERDFLSFAVPTIRGELKRHFRDCGWTVRPPRRVQEIHLRVLAARDRLAKDLGSRPTVAVIAADLDEAEQHVSEALRLDGCFVPTSLDQSLGDGTVTIGDLLPDADTREQEAAEARAMLAPAVRELDHRDRYVLQLRYVDGLTQQEIGVALGVTQTQVSRILTRVTNQLRSRLVETLEPIGA